MALTEQEKQELKQDILTAIKDDSQDVRELEEVHSLDGVKTLPAMRGKELVTVPISLLGKPATDAAAQALATKQAAETAAANATQAATNAGTKAQAAQDAATMAQKAAEDLAAVKTSAQQVIDQYEGVAVRALKGATARFDGILADAVIEQNSVIEVTGVYYVASKNIFVGKSEGKYYGNWLGADMYLTDNRTAIRKDKIYLLGSVLYTWNEADGTLAEASGTGGGNTINVSEKYPLAEGYYTLATAIKTVEDKLRAKGCCITFEASQGKWLTKQFVGTSVDSWEQEASWEDFGGAGTIKSVTVNGKKQTADVNGNVNITIDHVEVDETLDADSTNPVQNKAVTAKLREVEAGTVFGMTAELSEDESTVRLALTNKSGAEIASADIPAGSGGGGGDNSATKIVLTLEDIRRTQGGILPGKKIMSGKETLQNSYTNDTTYSVCKVGVEGFKRVRFPSVPGTNLIGSVFVDGAGKVISSVVVPTIDNKFEAGMYMIADIPEKAVNLHFTILNTAEFDCVVLSNSTRIEDMEPEWVANDEHLCAVVGSTVIGSKLRAAITGGSTTSIMTWTDFHYYSVKRGMQQIDALMHSRIANLFFARYGRRNSQEQCGAGEHTNTRITGGTASHGMQDTIGYKEAYSINNGVTDIIQDNGVRKYAWYRSVNEYGSAVVTQVNNICCLGYEDIYGHKFCMLDNVDVPNTGGNYAKWRIWMPSGTVRWVKGTSNSSSWITAVAHGKHMDMIAVGNSMGSSSTYYNDKFYFSGVPSRVAYYGYDGAHSHAGISSMYAAQDAHHSSMSIGSRLAFRGRIVKALSVAAYKATDEVE